MVLQVFDWLYIALAAVPLYLVFFGNKIEKPTKKSRVEITEDSTKVDVNIVSHILLYFNSFQIDYRIIYLIVTRFMGISISDV